jgi:hypothetical protein
MALTCPVDLDVATLPNEIRRGHAMNLPAEDSIVDVVISLPMASRRGTERCRLHGGQCVPPATIARPSQQRPLRIC